MARTTSKGERSATHIALLRAINVGGNNMLPMKDLTAMFVAAGCDDVRTYIQSGNVVFSARPPLAKTIPRVISAAILERFGHRVPVVTRTSDELRDVVRANPFLSTGVDLATLYVAFLAERPSPTRVSTLDANRSPPDEFVVTGREIYLRFPNGVGRTKLTNAYFEKLGTPSTLRNWRTVLKLVELTEPT